MNEREARRINMSHHEAILAHDGLHKTIRELREQNADLLAALHLCIPELRVDAEMSHFLQGFKRVETKEDRILKWVEDVIAKAEGDEL